MLAVVGVVGWLPVTTLMVGPTKWSGAKKRSKRPQTGEAIASLKQDVGRLPRQTVSRPEPVVDQRPKPTIKRKATLQRDEKRLRSLNKLLRQIETLQEREASGEELDEQQQDKVERLDSVLQEMETLMAGGETQ